MTSTSSLIFAIASWRTVVAWHVSLATIKLFSFVLAYSHKS